MDRYELVEGQASKFWEAGVTGTELTVRFGRIGTAGQTQTKTFDDDAAAQKAYEKLVKEKTGKGYGLVGSGVAAPPPVVKATVVAAAAPAPAQAAPPVAAPVVAAQPAAIASAPTALTIAEPSGGFAWTPALRAELPAVRGIHIPDGLRPPRADAPMPEFPPTESYELCIVHVDRMGQRLGAVWTYWGSAAPRHNTPDQLQRRDADAWRERIAQGLAGGQATARWSLDTCIALHGIAFTLEAALPLCMNAGTDVTQALLDPLRDAIAIAGEPEHAEARARAEALMRDAMAAGQDHVEAIARACAYAFPHVGAWAEAFLARDGLDIWLLQTCDVAVASFLASNYSMRSLRPGILLQVLLHGEEALPVLRRLLDQSLSQNDELRRALQIVARMRVPALLPLLIPHLDRKEVRAALEELAAEFPAAVLRDVIAQAMAGRDATPQAWAVRLGQSHAAALPAALAAVDPQVRSKFEALRPAQTAPDADPAELPPVLREPPWLRAGAKATVLPVLDLQLQPRPDQIAWSAERLAAARAYNIDADSVRGLQEHIANGYFPVSAEGLRRIDQGLPLEPGDVGDQSFHLDWVFALSPAQQIGVWNVVPPANWYPWDFARDVTRLLAQHGPAVLPGVAAALPVRPDETYPLIADIDSQHLVPEVLRAFRNLKKSRQGAQGWILGHAPTVLSVAVPAAFARGTAAPRDDARHAIAWLAANGQEAEVRAAAASYGPEAAHAVATLLAADPLFALPSRMPRLPSFFVPATMHRPLLRSGNALPLTAVEHLGTMLAISDLASPYAGLAHVRDACTPESLSAFAWDLFDAWLGAGAPPKEVWAFNAVGLIGGDEAARRLAPRIRAWPGEGFQSRAVTGLDVLAAIGSDVALMHLNAMAMKLRYKPLQERARERIAVVAEARGLTPEQLADRLVPDLGLDDDGTLTLDFGPRQFEVRFDEALVPFVRDPGGARLKDPPRPLKTDDAARAEPAVERWKLLKKDARAIASQQLVRLELAMVDRRRWNTGEFRACFLEHPLMRHLAARLVWGLYEDGQLASCFRVAEDFSLADASDRAFELPADAAVGIPHVLEMDAATQATFGQLFGDYEILQPFRQLGRETYAFGPQELEQVEITRFARTATSGGVLGLVNRGWRKGEAESGCVSWLHRLLPDGLEAMLQLDPGLRVGEFDAAETQHLPSLVLRQAGAGWYGEAVPFGRLTTMAVSELLRDIDLLAPAQD